jgi:hypothetical protein
VRAAPIGATELRLDTDPSVYNEAFTEVPVGTRVIIDRGPSEIVTTLTGQRPLPPLPPTNTAYQLIDLATPLPRAVSAHTRVDFEPAVPGTAIGRVNEWLTRSVGGLFDHHVQFSMALNRKDYEIYEPPYFHLPGIRPVLPPLQAGEVQVPYGATFRIRTDDAARITRVAIMRPAAVTHHTDTEQRFIELTFDINGTTSLSIDMVPATDSSLVPPGYYMLWILAGRLPCVEARFIQVTWASWAGRAPRWLRATSTSRTRSDTSSPGRSAGCCGPIVKPRTKA